MSRPATSAARAASGSSQHLADQARQDWIYLTAIIGGFAAQVTLTSEIRRRHQLTRGAMAAGATGAGASTAGMVACCAHHLADLLPLVGAATAGPTGATFLVVLDTHSVELSVDLVASSKLSVDGTDWPVARWDGATPEGHHREGELRFSAVSPVEGRAVLTITSLPETVTVGWDVGGD